MKINKLKSISIMIFALTFPTTAQCSEEPDYSEKSPFIAGCKAISGVAEVSRVVNDLHERITAIKDAKRRQAIESSFSYCTNNGYVVYYTAPHRSSTASESHPYFYAYPYHVRVHKVWFGDPKKYPGAGFSCEENLREHLQQLLNEVNPAGVYGVPPDGALNVSVIAEKRGTAKLKNPNLKLGGGNHLYFEYSLIARFPFRNQEQVIEGVDHLFVGPIMQNDEIFTKRKSVRSSVILADKKTETTIPNFGGDKSKKGNYLVSGGCIGAAVGGYFSESIYGAAFGGIVGAIIGYNIES